MGISAEHIAALNTELCTVRLTEVSEFQREETGMWEKNEQVVYTGQWMLSELNREFPTWLTIWPWDKMVSYSVPKPSKQGMRTLTNDSI